MYYNYFKKIINSVKVVDQELYNELINFFGRQKIKQYFEKYLKDNTIPLEDKINKTKIYLRNKNHSLTNSAFQENLYSTEYFIQEIKKIPDFSKQEEKEMFRKLGKLKHKLFEHNITKESINDNLKKIGIAFNSHNISESITYLQNLLNKIKKENICSKENLYELENLSHDIKLYSCYQNLINQIAQAYLKKVITVAKIYKNCGIPLIDLIQTGSIGLVNAIKNYDVSRETTFHVFAFKYIKDVIYKSLAIESKPVKIPYTEYSYLYRVTISERNLQTKLNREPTLEEILDYFKQIAIKNLRKKGNQNPTEEEINDRIFISRQKLEEILKMKRTNLAEPLNYNDYTFRNGPFYEDFVDNKLIINEYYIFLKNILRKLDLRTQLIIILKYGLELAQYMSFNDFNDILRKYNSEITSKYIRDLYINLSNNPNEMSLSKIGLLLNITKTRVDQIEKKGFERLERLSITEKKLAKIL